MSLHLYNENRTYVGRHISICVFSFLLLMAFNYLNFNLYGRNDLLLAAGRILSSLMLVYLILNHPRMQISSLGFLYLAFLAFILGESKSLIPINVIFIITFVVASKNIPIKKLIDYSYFTCCFSLLIVFLSLQLGFTENYLDTQGVRSRSTFGFANTNSFSGLVGAAILLGFVRIKWAMKPFLHLTALLLFTYYAYDQTDNRTLLVTIILYFTISLGFLIIKSKLVLRFLALLAIISPVLIVNMLPYILVAFPSLDFLLSYRLTYAVRYMSGFSDLALFFGGAYSGEHATDIGLVLMQSNLGIVFVLTSMIFIYRLALITINLRLNNIFAFVITFWIVGISESMIIRPEAIIGLVFWVLLIRSKELSSLKIY